MKSPRERDQTVTFLDSSTLQKPFLKRSEALDSCKNLYLQIVYWSVKMHNDHSTWCSLGAEGILREFLSPWRKFRNWQETEDCTTSPEKDFSVIAQINQPAASIFDTTLSYNSSSLIFPVPIHFFCLILHHTMWTTTCSWCTWLVK